MRQLLVHYISKRVIVLHLLRMIPRQQSQNGQNLLQKFFKTLLILEMEVHDLDLQILLFQIITFIILMGQQALVERGHQSLQNLIPQQNVIQFSLEQSKLPGFRHHLNVCKEPRSDPLIHFGTIFVVVRILRGIQVLVLNGRLALSPF